MIRAYLAGAATGALLVWAYAVAVEFTAWHGYWNGKGHR